MLHARLGLNRHPREPVSITELTLITIVRGEHHAVGARRVDLGPCARGTAARFAADSI